MRSAMFTHFKSVSSRKNNVVEFTFNDAADHTDIAGNTETKEVVRKALTMLSPRQREVAHLRATGLNNREIGERYGLTPERIRQEMVDACAKITRSSAFVPELMAA